MTGHELHDIKAVEVIGPHTLRLRFEDGVVREVDLSGITEGQMYGPLRDPDFFAKVRLNPEIETIEWPNGADFDPETLYYWDRYRPEWIKAANAMRTIANLLTPIPQNFLKHGQPKCSTKEELSSSERTSNEAFGRCSGTFQKQGNNILART